MKRRYTDGASSSAATQSLEYALQARRMVDVDNPTIENLQTLLLLSQTFFAHGLGKKAYMTFCKLTHSRKQWKMLTISHLRGHGDGLRAPPRAPIPCQSVSP